MSGKMLDSNTDNTQKQAHTTKEASKTNISTYTHKQATKQTKQQNKNKHNKHNNNCGNLTTAYQDVIFMTYRLQVSR